MKSKIIDQKLNEAINKVKSKTLKEQLSNYSKDTDEWFDDIATISENYFENGRSEPVLEDLLKLSDWIDTKIRPSVRGVTLKQFELFKKEVSKLRHPLLKSLHKFLDDLTPTTYSDEYKYFSNDNGGNVSVVQGIMSLFNQAVNYYGDIDEYYENKLGESKNKNLHENFINKIGRYRTTYKKQIFLKKITEAAEYVEPEVKAQIDDIIGTLRDENFYNKDARRKFVNHLHNLVTLENESPEARKSVKKFVKYVSDAITEYELDIADDSDIVDEEPIEENVDNNAKRMRNMRMKSEGRLNEGIAKGIGLIKPVLRKLGLSGSDFIVIPDKESKDYINFNDYGHQLYYSAEEGKGDVDIYIWDDSLQVIQGYKTLLDEVNVFENESESIKFMAYFLNIPERNVIKNLRENKRLNEGDKIYYQTDNVGRSKYTVSYHDGKKTHKDGSPFYDIAIFKNKIDLNNFINDLIKQGYRSRRFGENKNLKPEQKLDEALSKVKGYLKEKELTTVERNALPDSAFVFPKERKYPIHDENHARDALAYVSQHGTSAEQAKVKSAVKSKYPQMEVK